MRSLNTNPARWLAPALPCAALLLCGQPARAAGTAALDGASFGPLWGLPFLGLLLSIAILPQLAHRFWDRHLGSLSGSWSLALLVPLVLTRGLGPSADAVAHTLLAEYLPFIVLLFALYTIAGGVVVLGNLHGTPLLNTGLLAFGTVLASLVGTTGAAMVLVRPVIRANDGRRHNVHVLVFFIFLVANIGGALSPLGDPPLFLGYLRGVDFFWPTRTLSGETALAAGLLLALFFFLDTWLERRAGSQPRPVDPTPDDGRLRLRGRANLVLAGLAVAAIVAAGLWRPPGGVPVGSTLLGWNALLRDAALLALAGLSLALTSRRNRAANDFGWRPIAEVAKIFAGIFVCMVPVTAMLSAGRGGSFAPLLAAVTRPGGEPDTLAYFWATGLLSSVLDNAPTYLVFFDLAGGDAAHLMGPGARTLAAVSTGAVFMGANTYLGNAPNFMVYAIARQAGVRMPGFLGYLLWSGTILLPLFLLLGVLFHR